jgi:multisubunit Na+/H+ antiporter MnhG subunit|uniref:Uncharacterized protein n=1 Tax=viral metagenome TaxID=1070528 RepID=A0A6C0CYV6_9ZZZZ
MNKVQNSHYDVSHYNIGSMNGIANILIGLTLFSIFLCIFYFTYASKVENDILGIQIKNLVDSLTENIEATPIDRNALLAILDNVKVNDLSAADAQVKASNDTLIHKAVVALAIFGIVSIAIIAGLWYVYRFDLKTLLAVNLLLLLFIALTEIFFLNVIAKAYRSLDPNAVKKNIVDKIRGFKNL